VSIRVELDALPAAVDQQARVAYLLTTSGDRVHAMAVVPSLRAGSVVCAAGATARANAAERPAVTLLWPPSEPGGHTLLVDGTATVEDDKVAVTPTTAVLHVTRDASTDPR
jgi:hypothetical protein